MEWWRQQFWKDFITFGLKQARDVTKLKKIPNIQITFGSRWVGPVPFWIENEKLENHKKMMIIGFQFFFLIG